MTVKNINSTRTAYTRAVREGFQNSAVIVSSVIALLLLFRIDFVYAFSIILQRYNIFKPNPNIF